MGKIGIILGFQSTSPVEEEVGSWIFLVDLASELFNWSICKQNFVGGGCLETKDCGLSKFGIELVERMNELGITIDLSHVGNQTSKDAVETSRKPVCCTHAKPLWTLFTS